MTYGQIRNRVALEAPGFPLQLLDGYLLDRYTSILDQLKWKRLDSDVVITTSAPYTTGTLNVANGSNAVTLTGGAFTAAMTGFAIQIDARDEIYEFTYVSATTGTLDRAFPGTSDAVATYSIFQSVYPLPADCRILTQITSPTYGPLGKLSQAQQNQSVIATAMGPPASYANYMDDGSTPPRMQIRIYPVPDGAYPLVVTYTTEASAIAGTGTTLQPWLRPACLIAGALADALEKLGNYQRAGMQEAKYERYLADMVRTDAQNRNPQPLRQAGWLTRHNAQRAMRGAPRAGVRLP